MNYIFTTLNSTFSVRTPMSGKKKDKTDKKKVKEQDKKKTKEDDKTKGKEDEKKVTTRRRSQTMKGRSTQKTLDEVDNALKRHPFWAHETLEDTDDPFADDFGDDITAPRH